MNQPSDLNATRPLGRGEKRNRKQLNDTIIPRSTTRYNNQNYSGEGDSAAITIHLRKSTLKKLQRKAKYRGIELEKFIQQNIDPDPTPPPDDYNQTWTYWGLEAQGIPLDFGLTVRKGFPDLPFVRNPTREEEAGLNAHTRPDLNAKIRDYKKLTADILADMQIEREGDSYE